MKCKMIFGALLVSVALCSQGFGFELLDRVLGLNGGGCGECNACAKVACCEKACPKACEVPVACEQVGCEKACGKCRKCRRTPVRDMFAGLKEMCEAKGVYCETGCNVAKGCAPEPACCEKACPKPACCEKACPKPACCEKACHKPACCEKACPTGCEVACEKPCRVKKVRKVHCAEKACGECGPAACEKACPVSCVPTCETVSAPKCHKLYRRPAVELLENLFSCKCKKCCKAGCEAGSCEVSCGPAGCGGGAPVKAAPAPAKKPEAAPLPAAPKADPSAAIESRGIYEASRTLVRN